MNPTPPWPHLSRPFLNSMLAFTWSLVGPDGDAMQTNLQLTFTENGTDPGNISEVCRVRSPKAPVSGPALASAQGRRPVRGVSTWSGCEQ